MSESATEVLERKPTQKQPVENSKQNQTVPNSLYKEMQTTDLAGKQMTVRTLDEKAYGKWLKEQGVPLHRRLKGRIYRRLWPIIHRKEINEITTRQRENYATFMSQNPELVDENEQFNTFLAQHPELRPKEDQNV